MAAAMGQLEFDGAAGSPGAFGDAKRSLVIVGGIQVRVVLGYVSVEPWDPTRRVFPLQRRCEASRKNHAI